LRYPRHPGECRDDVDASADRHHGHREAERVGDGDGRAGRPGGPELRGPRPGDEGGRLDRADGEEGTDPCDDRLGFARRERGAGGAGGAGGGAGGGGASSGTSSTSSTTPQILVISSNSWIVNATVDSSSVGLIKTNDQAQLTVTGATGTVYGTVSSIGLVSS